MHYSILRDDIRMDDIRNKAPLVVHDISKCPSFTNCDSFTCGGRVVGLRVPREDDSAVYDMVQDKVVEVRAVNVGRDVMVLDSINECLIDGREECNGWRGFDALENTRWSEPDKRGQVGGPVELIQREGVYHLRWQIDYGGHNINEDLCILNCAELSQVRGA